MGNLLGSKTLETVTNLVDILNEIGLRKSCLNAHIYLVSLMYVTFWRSLFQSRMFYSSLCYDSQDFPSHTPS